MTDTPPSLARYSASCGLACNIFSTSLPTEPYTAAVANSESAQAAIVVPYYPCPTITLDPGATTEPPATEPPATEPPATEPGEIGALLPREE